MHACCMPLYCDIPREGAGHRREERDRWQDTGEMDTRERVEVDYSLTGQGDTVTSDSWVLKLKRVCLSFLFCSFFYVICEVCGMEYRYGSWVFIPLRVTTSSVMWVCSARQMLLMIVGLKLWTNLSRRGRRFVMKSIIPNLKRGCLVEMSVSSSVVCPKRESNPRFLGHNEMP